MPDIFRLPLRMDCKGFNINCPVDRVPPGYFSYLFNVRVTQEGWMEGRPGYTQSIPASSILPSAPNSIRRLNDPAELYAPKGYTYVGGVGTNLFCGVETAYAQIDTGYSGNPLSLIPFRPNNSPESWMYAYDQNKLVKVRPDGVLRAIGVVPPGRAPSIEYAAPASVDINTGQSASGFSATGISSSPTATDRTNSSGVTIGSILYNSGTTGWCCINPAMMTPQTFWMGSRMKVILQANSEEVLVRDVLPAIASTTVGSIIYDSGTSGLCSITLINSPTGLARNSLLQIDAEIVRVLEVIQSPTGSAYSVRCSTTSTHAVGATVTGLLSWYTYTTINHAPAETITSEYIAVTQSVAGVGGVSLTSAINAAVANNRPIDPANDYLHISIYLQNPSNVTSLQLLVSLDPTPNFSFSNPGNSWIWNIPGTTLTANSIVGTVAPTVAQISLAGEITGVQNGINQIQAALKTAPSEAYPSLQAQLALLQNQLISLQNQQASQPATATGPQITSSTGSASSWVEIIVPISSAVVSGSNPTLNFSNISGIALQITTAGACNYGFDWWYFSGTYGPTVQPNSPTGMVYYSSNRDSSTGAHSVPGPGNRQALFPLREGVIVTPQYSTQSGVDSNDIYRLGASVTSPLYTGTTPNSGTYLDNLPDTVVLSTNQPPDLTALQPWPLLQPPWKGTCNVSGTSVQITSGSTVSLTLEDATAILINGQTYLTYGLPHTTTFFELTQDAGSLTGVSFLISSPTITGQPLPYAFGALEGPFAPVIFGLGDSINGGLLYYTNYSDADSANDSNTLEVTSPSNNLVSGDVWKGIAFCGSREEIFTVQYSYLSTIGAVVSNQFQWRKINSPSGMWSRWSCCACPVGVAFLGRDGIYICTDTQSVNITDEALYPMFPHEGQAARAVYQGSNVIFPVDMTQYQFLRLSYCDEELRFAYLDTAGNWNTLIYEIFKKRWFLNNYENNINFHYLVENSAALPNQPQILQMALDTKAFMLAGGNTDNGTAINSQVLTPSDDGKDERAQKLYVDSMVQYGGTGTLGVVPTYNNAQINAPTINIACNGSIQQTQINIASLSDLALYRNIAALFLWSGGSAGPRIAAWEPSGFLQPYLSQRFTTQFIILGFPGWKHTRRMYPALISNSPVLFTIVTQDGRPYGPVTIPSTNGTYRVLPQMLPQNIKDLSFALQLDGQGNTFAFFPGDFVIELKEWTEDSYIKLAVFKS